MSSISPSAPQKQDESVLNRFPQLEMNVPIQLSQAQFDQLCIRVETGRSTIASYRDSSFVSVYNPANRTWQVTRHHVASLGERNASDEQRPQGFDSILQAIAMQAIVPARRPAEAAVASQRPVKKVAVSAVRKPSEPRLENLNSLLHAAELASAPAQSLVQKVEGVPVRKAKNEARLIALLDAWSRAVPSVIENREKAEMIILEVFLASGQVLNLAHLHLSSLPDGLFDYLTQLTEINLSCNNFINCPDLSRCVKLQVLRLERNKFVTAPNIRACIELSVLNLSLNQLTTPPDVSQCYLLVELYLSTNKLTAPPDVSRCVYLKILDLTECCLFEPPDLQLCSRLQSLKLGINPLRCPPVLNRCIHLRELYLGGCGLKNAPDLHECVLLRRISLGKNRLKISPNVRGLAELTHLNLSRNSLRDIPDVTGCVSLYVLDLEDNQIRQLSDCLSYISPDGSVILKNNSMAIPDRPSLNEFLNRLRAQRLPSLYIPFRCKDTEANRETLRQTVMNWFDEFQHAFPRSSCPDAWAGQVERKFVPLNWSNCDLDFLDSYFHCLRNIVEYDSDDLDFRNKMIFNVDRMIRFMLENSTFRGELLKLIRVSSLDHQNDMTIYFNYVMILFDFCQNNLSVREARALAIGEQRFKQLIRYGLQQARERNFDCPISVVLHYLHALREPLNLPMVTRHGRYIGILNISQQMLDEAASAIRAIPDRELLADSDHFRSYLRCTKDPRIVAIAEQSSRLVKAAQSYFELSDASREECLSRDEFAEFATVIRGTPAEHVMEYGSLFKYLMCWKEEKLQIIIDGEV